MIGASEWLPKKLKMRTTFKGTVNLTRNTLRIWNESDPWRLSAVVAYYSLLSLPGLIVITVQLVGTFWGGDIEGKLSGEFAATIGADTAATIEAVLENSHYGDKHWFAAALGIATLIFGATGVFYHLQYAINKIWGMDTLSSSGFKAVVIDRLISFGFVLALGFLLLVSFFLTALLSVFSARLKLIFPEAIVVLAQVLDFVLGILFIGGLFALMFKYLPYARLPWKAIQRGALLTALLFAVGKSLIGIYFGTAEPGSTYGAAGSVVLILLWVSYASLILFIGAAYIRAYCERHNIEIEQKD